MRQRRTLQPIVSWRTRFLNHARLARPHASTKRLVGVAVHDRLHRLVAERANSIQEHFTIVFSIPRVEDDQPPKSTRAYAAFARGVKARLATSLTPRVHLLGQILLTQNPLLPQARRDDLQSRPGV